MERLDFCGQRVKELKRHRVFACRWRIFDCRGLREKGSTGLRNHEGNRGVGWATSLSKGWTLGRRRRRAGQRRWSQKKAGYRGTSPVPQLLLAQQSASAARLGACARRNPAPPKRDRIAGQLRVSRRTPLHLPKLLAQRVRY